MESIIVCIDKSQVFTNVIESLGGQLGRKVFTLNSFDEIFLLDGLNIQLLIIDCNFFKFFESVLPYLSATTEVLLTGTNDEFLKINCTYQQLQKPISSEKILSILEKLN